MDRKTDWNLKCTIVHILLMRLFHWPFFFLKCPYACKAIIRVGFAVWVFVLLNLVYVDLKIKMVVYNHWNGLVDWTQVFFHFHQILGNWLLFVI